MAVGGIRLLVLLYSYVYVLSVLQPTNATVQLLLFSASEHNKGQKGCPIEFREYHAITRLLSIRHVCSHNDRRPKKIRKEKKSEIQDTRKKQALLLTRPSSLLFHFLYSTVDQTDDKNNTSPQLLLLKHGAFRASIREQDGILEPIRQLAPFALWLPFQTLLARRLLFGRLCLCLALRLSFEKSHLLGLICPKGFKVSLRFGFLSCLFGLADTAHSEVAPFTSARSPRLNSQNGKQKRSKGNSRFSLRFSNFLTTTRPRGSRAYTAPTIKCAAHQTGHRLRPQKRLTNLLAPCCACG